jgi:hypothetical protein
MTDSDNAQTFSGQWFRHKAALFGLNVFAFMLMLGSLGASAVFVRNSLLWLTLNAAAGVALSVGAVSVLAVLSILPAIAREHFKGAYGVLPGGLIGFAAGATALLAYIFAGVSFAMSRLGWIAYASDKRPDDLIVDLSESYMWHVYDLIPAIEVNRTLGEEAPRIVLETVVINGVPDQKGLVLLAFRLMVALVLFRTVLRLFERPKAAEPRTMGFASAAH